MYHGAEHKCINCIEHGLPLTVENVRVSSKEHKRCGTSFLMFVMIVIGSFLAFDYVKLLTGGGPAHSTEVLGTYAYSYAFSSMQVGKAAAVGLFMSFFGLIASGIYARLSRKEEMQ